MKWYEVRISEICQVHKPSELSMLTNLCETYIPTLCLDTTSPSDKCLSRSRSDFARSSSSYLSRIRICKKPRVLCVFSRHVLNPQCWESSCLQVDALVVLSLISWGCQYAQTFKIIHVLPCFAFINCFGIPHWMQLGSQFPRVLCCYGFIFCQAAVQKAQARNPERLSALRRSQEFKFSFTSAVKPCIDFQPMGPRPTPTSLQKTDLTISVEVWQWEIWAAKRSKSLTA